MDEQSDSRSRIFVMTTLLRKKEKGNLAKKTSQELRMLSSVTINCQVTKIFMNSGSQLSELSVSQMSQVPGLSLSLSLLLYVSFCCEHC